MGLDFDRSDARWSYGGFHRFRRRLAEAEGINLDEMEGFGALWGTGDTPLVSWDSVDTPIKDLLHHSDCDGRLTVTQMRRIIPRMLEIVLGWEANDYDRIQALKLIEGMGWCIANRKMLNFR